MSSGGTLPILRGVSPGPQLYSHALSAAYRHEWPIFEPSFSENKENDVWELIRRDAKIMQAIDLRTKSVASKDTSVDPGGEEEQDLALAEFVDDALKCIRGFRESRMNLATAIFRGRAFGWIQGRREHKKVGRFPARNWWLPYKIRDVDKRRFQLTPKMVGDRITTTTEIWHVGAAEYRPIKRPELFIEIIYGDEEARLRYGRPLLDSLYFLWWAKANVLQQGLQALEKWAQGFIVAKIDTERAGALETDTDSVRDEALAQIEKHRSRNVLVMDRRDEVEVVGGSSTGHDMVQDFLTYLDNQILGLALGAVLPFGGAGDTGSFARAQVEQDVSNELLEFDRTKIDEAITDRLVHMVCELNAPILSEFGIDVRNMRKPRFFTSTKVVEDPAKNADVLTKILTVPGMELDKDWVYGKIGAPRPKKSAETFKAPEGVAPGGGGLSNAVESSRPTENDKPKTEAQENREGGD